MTAADIARMLGTASPSGAWWRCRCPVHGSRGATLALRDGERGLIIKCWAGCDPRDVLAELRHRGLAGHSNLYCSLPARRGTTGDDLAGRIAAARQLWNAAQGTRREPLVHYLRGRGLSMPPPPSLRWVPRCRHSGARRELPAMVAAIADVAGALIGLHRTYLRSDGSGKADVQPVKMMLGAAAGGAVRLAEPITNLPLVIAEGIESAMAAAELSGWPAWAALSAAGLRRLVLPPAARDILIAVDHDRSEAGEAAARAAAQRWLGEGRRVRLVIPDRIGADPNDLLREVHNGAA